MKIQLDDLSLYTVGNCPKCKKVFVRNILDNTLCEDCNSKLHFWLKEGLQSLGVLGLILLLCKLLSYF